MARRPQGQEQHAPGQGSTRARTRGRPSPDVAAQIDREILAAARELFFTQGYARTSMAMIVRAAAVSKTTLYARYADKAQLFRATVSATIEEIGAVEPTNPAYAQFGLVEGLERFGRDALTGSFVPLWMRYERLVFAEGPHFPEMTDLVATQVQLAIERVTRFLRHCMDRDGVTLDEPEGLATTYLTALRGYYTEALLAVRVPAVEEREAFVRLLVRNLLPREMVAAR